jgi:hypothetical protein
MPSKCWNYVDVNCQNCNKPGSIRIDQYNRKNQKWTCRSCTVTGRKNKIKNPSAKHDPKKLGAYKSYWRAKKRVQENHSNCYGHVKFLFKSFDEFWQELGERPVNASLDRIDPKGNYEPGNVRWATVAEQNRNRRNNIFVYYKGKKMCLYDAARITGKDPGALKHRLETGCPSEFLFESGKWFSKTQKFFLA